MSSLLKCAVDRYNGVLVDEVSLPAHAAEFETSLDASLQSWISDGRRGIWIKVPIEKSALIPVAVSKGFVFHHAQPSHVMLTRWLSSEENKLPHYAHTHLGVGGLVLNENNEVLVITERYFIGGTDMWKIPGGALDLGEDISAAAVREVFEETGIRTRFESCLSFRHLHGYNFGRSDIYFVCLLRPEGNLEVHPDPGEIAQCKWMKVEEFASLTHTYPLQQEIAKIALAVSKGEYKGMEEVRVQSFRSDKTSAFYRAAPEKDS
jgi:8-oxo-dGTP pyrophosphatase MutT (NUDIX family)